MSSGRCGGGSSHLFVIVVLIIIKSDTRRNPTLFKSILPIEAPEKRKAQPGGLPGNAGGCTTGAFIGIIGQNGFTKNRIWFWYLAWVVRKLQLKKALFKWSFNKYKWTTVL